MQMSLWGVHRCVESGVSARRVVHFHPRSAAVKGLTGGVREREEPFWHDDERESYSI